MPRVKIVDTPKFSNGGPGPQGEINLNLPRYEEPKGFFTGYGFSQNVAPSVNMHGLGAHGERKISDRIKLTGDINSPSIFYPGGSQMFMNPSVNVGVKYRFEDGGEPCPKDHVRINNKCVSIKSEEYRKAYESGIGRWVAYDENTKSWKQSDASNPNAQWISSIKTLPAITVKTKINPYVKNARKQAFEQVGSFDEFRKQKNANYPSWYKNSTMYNPDKDYADQKAEYDNIVNAKLYQNILDAIPQKEGESRLEYMNRLNQLAGKNTVNFAKQYGLTEPFEPGEWKKLKQWGKKGLYDVAGTIGTALTSWNPSISNLISEQSKRYGNEPVSGLNEEEAANVGIFQPLESLDRAFYNYALNPAMQGMEQLMRSPQSYNEFKTYNRYKGPTDADLMVAGFLNPANYINPGKIVSIPLKAAPHLLKPAVYVHKTYEFLKPGFRQASKTYNLTSDLPFIPRVKNALASGTTAFYNRGDILSHSMFNQTPEAVGNIIREEIKNLPLNAAITESSLSKNSAPIFWSTAARGANDGFTIVRTGKTNPLNWYGTKGKRVAQAIPSNIDRTQLTFLTDLEDALQRRINYLKSTGDPNHLKTALDLEKQGVYPEMIQELLTDSKNNPYSKNVLLDFMKRYKPTLDQPITEVNKRTGLNFPEVKINQPTRGNVFEYEIPEMYAIKGTPTSRFKEALKADLKRQTSHIRNAMKLIKERDIEPFELRAKSIVNPPYRIGIGAGRTQQAFSLFDENENTSQKFGPGGSVANGCGPFMAKNSAGQCVPENLAHLPPTSTNLLGSTQTRKPSATQQMGMATVPGQYGKGSVDYSMGANPLTVAKQQKQYQDIKSEREYQKERSKQTSVGPARKKTPMEEDRDQALKQQFVTANPGYSKLDEQGNIVPTQVDRGVAGTPDYGSRAYYNDRGLNTFAEGLEAASMVTGAGELALAAKPFLKQALSTAARSIKPYTTVARQYGKDFIETSVAAGRPKLPTYQTAYRWQADVIPEGLKQQGINLTSQQKGLTGSWYTYKPEQVPFYMRTRPGSGNVNMIRLSDAKIKSLEGSMPEYAKGMSGKTLTTTADDHMIGELVVPENLRMNPKTMRFDLNPADYPIDPKLIQGAEPGSALYKAGLEENIKNITLPMFESTQQNILGIPRKYFPFKKGGSVLKSPLMQYYYNKTSRI